MENTKYSKVDVNEQTEHKTSSGLLRRLGLCFSGLALLGTCTFNYLRPVYAESPVLTGSQYGTALENAMREGNKDRIRFLLDAMRQENEYYSEKFAKEAQRKAEQKTKQEAEAELKQLREQLEKERQEARREGQAEESKLEFPQGYKVVQHTLGEFVLCSCREARDFDKNGVTEYPSDFRGIKSRFTQDETMMLYCNSAILRRNLGLKIISLDDQKVCYNGVNNNLGYGIVPEFECSGFNPGRYLAIFSQGEQQIGTLDFEIIGKKRNTNTSFNPNIDTLNKDFNLTPNNALDNPKISADGR